MAVKGLVAAIVQFLTHQLEDGGLSEDSRESIEVALQCLETAYNVQASDAPPKFKLYDVYKAALEEPKPEQTKWAPGVSRVPTDPAAKNKPEDKPEATPEAKAEAERYKNEGNALVKAEKLEEAINNYTKAIELDSRNAVYYCNRAAVYSKLGNHPPAIIDCHNALLIDPMYSKAYGRLGLAYSSLGLYKQAKKAYEDALELEPDNEGYRNNLLLASENLYRESGNRLTPDVGAVLNNVYANPAVYDMLQRVISEGPMLDIISNMFSNTDENSGQRMEGLVEAGMQIARELRISNSDMLRVITRQLAVNPNETCDRDPNDPNPPQNH